MGAGSGGSVLQHAATTTASGMRGGGGEWRAGGEGRGVKGRVWRQGVGAQCSNML